MRFLEVLAVASVGNALSIGLLERNTGLDVKLEMTGNTAVEATVTNLGSTALKVFKTGTILDDRPVEKVQVFQGDYKVQFDGARLYISTRGLDESAFKVIAPGESLKAKFDIAEAHDVSSGGSFDLLTEGALSYAKADSTELTGTVTFKSNVLSTEIDGSQAAATRHSYLSKALLNALAICATRATAAAAAAQTNTAKIIEYFKLDSAAVKTTVAGVFKRIATECASSATGVSKQYCTDQLKLCGGGVMAYTSTAQAYIVNCPGYFSVMPAKDTRCHADDQPSVTIHEMTHLRQIKGTEDYGAYGYEAVRRLNAAQNLNHADTYAYFANAIEAGSSC